MFSADIAAATRLTEGRPLRRLPDWEARLSRWINAAQNRRWDPGRWDCCMSWCDAVLEMTGVDPGARVRGRYTTMLGAAQVVIKLHHPEVDSFEAAVAAEMAHHGLVGWERVSQARRGDIVCYDERPPHGVTWGIVDLTGERVVAATRPSGLMWGPVAKCRRAWAVG